MSLLRIRDLHLAFGGPELLSGAQLILEKGERVCLVGRNGTGKSTLLKIVSGEIKPDEGQIEIAPTTKIAWLEQEVPRDAQGSIYDVVASGLGKVGELIKRYHDLIEAMASGDEDAFTQLEPVQRDLEAMDGWGLQQRVETTLSTLSLDGDNQFEDQSGGVKRRVLLARALVQDPDILLLDEPTNHLDIDSIAWLEEFLLNFRNSVLFITHDRAFLSKLATRIVDLDRGQLTSWPGNYHTYLERKAEHLNAEALEWDRFDKKLSQEETWIRQGIKARRTRNEGRVRALEEMRKQRSQRRERQGTMSATIQQAESSGKKVIEAKHLQLSFGGQSIIDDFSTLILRGDRIGFIGPNGIGKSTLIKVLLGQMQADSGTVNMGTNVEVAYFDQLRGQLNESQSVRENVGQGSDTVTINGQDKHVIGYLQDFLFSPDRAHTPVKALSGGERNRLLLAKLFTQPANLLVLDEPTNDLDIETLELLEELVDQFQGTILLVSHDRQFLNNIVTSTLVFGGNGKIDEFVGGYDDWLRQRPAVTSPQSDTKKSAQTAAQLNTQAEPVKPGATKPRKLSYKDQKELESLPLAIETLEQSLEDLHQKLADPDLYQESPDQVNELTRKAGELETELEATFERWEELEALRNGA
ncbi:ATP-binding cassette domain-containing protein [Ketobacter sp. MCCC 1A13808]|uniref:ATP-binding cassette domain-containing protein n=1 Tax=Ketobacter sp. MCCC 1A13808 TaxID=2602738 RepID=UPI0012EC5069|nr:ATP-binding cassette domain-containing protein [Ketobacter sp. MCCC 1A13808]MVF12912.1 ATP-binding cassette domain-containing protein [Ketobacter sp. MCCC 1A13808]